MSYIVSAIALLMLFVFLWKALNKAHGTHLFDYDELNPYRRQCKKCGRVYELWKYFKGSGWEECYNEASKAPSCECQNYAHYE